MWKVDARLFLLAFIVLLSLGDTRSQQEEGPSYDFNQVQKLVHEAGLETSRKRYAHSASLYLQVRDPPPDLLLMKLIAHMHCRGGEQSMQAARGASSGLRNEFSTAKIIIRTVFL